MTIDDEETKTNHLSKVIGKGNYSKTGKIKHKAKIEVVLVILL